MGWWNLIDEEWTCPFCGKRQRGEIRIRYGGQAHTFRVGDKVIWEVAAPGMGDRLPGDSGVIEAEVMCENSGREKWQKTKGSKWLEEWDDRTIVDEVKRLGCPYILFLDVQIDQNIIKRVYFPEDRAQIHVLWV